MCCLNTRLSSKNDFMTGQSIAHYRITAKLGQGGMGAVYRATDTKLDREVAIKVLPESFAQDKERLARFDREAKALAALNHPNIAGIFGIEQTGNSQALILELVEGEDLSERLKRGALPVDEALDVGKQIAEALEAAHEKGIIHRDLKPGNVKLCDDGRVKVLDFGLAKALVGDSSATGPADSISPTITADYTLPGTLLGTAGYMSPEQARGKTVDKRSDIWSFGCVLYECLTGKRMFKGEDTTQILAKILESEPDWGALPQYTPATIQLLLRKCLAKDRKRRLHDVADARVDLEQAIADPTTSFFRLSEEAQTVRTMSFPVFACITLGIAVVAVTLTWFLKPAFPPLRPPPISRLDLNIPDGQRLTESDFSFAVPMALSPDGTLLVYSATTGGQPQLYLRSLDRDKPEPLRGTEGGTSPFFSPDGTKLGFFARGKLKKLFLPDGTPETIGDAPSYLGNGATWGKDGMIIFAPTLGGLAQISSEAHGDKPEILTPPLYDEGEYGHAWPQFLPDGKHVLFEIWGSRASVAVLSLESHKWDTLFPLGQEGSSGVCYLPTGHIVYGNATGLFAVRFDPKHLEVKSDAVSVFDGVHFLNYSGRASFVVSDTGTVVYQPSHLAERTLVWVDRDTGKPIPVTDKRGPYLSPSLSPSDDDRLLYLSFAPENAGIWIYKIDRGTTLPVMKGGLSSAPVWKRDGTQITFASRAAGAYNLTTKSADGSGDAEPLLSGVRRARFPMSWSPDGTLAYYQYDSMSGRDVWMLTPDGEPQPFLTDSYNEGMLRFSPDGHFVAYVSDESGQQEVYLEAYPRRPGGRILISTDGGREPVWSRDGRELFYRNGDQMMVVSTEELATGKPPGKPLPLFTGHYASDLLHDFDISSDGQRFLMIQEDDATARPQFKIILNWFDELNRKMPPASEN